jgi:hypothetical protein
LPQGNALRICNKLNIFKGVRLPNCAPRLIWRQIFIAQHFRFAGAKGGNKSSASCSERPPLTVIRTGEPVSSAGAIGDRREVKMQLAQFRCIAVDMRHTR